MATLVNNHGHDVEWQQRRLRSEPTLHPTAVVRGSVLGRYVDIGADTKVIDSRIDDYSYTTERCDIINATVGKFVNLATGVRLNPGNHPVERATLHHFTYRSVRYGLGADDASVFAWRREHPVTIGHDVWIGHGAVVLPGVTIATGSVVGAGAVVTKDVPAYTIVAGVPAQPLRRRFDADVCEGLERLAWWDWSHDKLEATLEDFRGLSAADFVRKHTGGRAG